MRTVAARAGCRNGLAAGSNSIGDAERLAEQLEQALGVVEVGGPRARPANRPRRAGRSGRRRAGAARRSATAARPGSGRQSAALGGRRLRAGRRARTRRPRAGRRRGRGCGRRRRAGRRSGRCASPTARPKAGCGPGPARCGRARRRHRGTGSTKLQATASSRPASRSRSSRRRSSCWWRSRRPTVPFAPATGQRRRQMLVETVDPRDLLDQVDLAGDVEVAVGRHGDDDLPVLGADPAGCTSKPSRSR